MNLVNSALGMVLASALMLQACICVVRRDRLTLLGVLNMLFATCGLASFIALRSGSLVIGSDFSIVLVQGPRATFFLALALIAVCTGASLFWLATEVAVGRQPGFRFSATVCVIGFVAGLSASLHFVYLTTSNYFLLPLQAVHFYGMWYPPVVLWLTICLSQSIVALFGMQGRLNRVWLAVFFIALIPVYALGCTEIRDPATTDPGSQAAWFVISALALPGIVGLSAYKVNRPKLRKWARVPALLSFAICLIATGPLDNSRLDIVRGGLTLALLCLFFLLFAWPRCRLLFTSLSRGPSEDDIALRALAYWRLRGSPTGSPDVDWNRARRDLRREAAKTLLTPYVLSSLLFIFVFSTFDLFYLSIFPIEIDFTIAFVSWLSLSEFLSKGAFVRIPEWLYRLVKGSSAPAYARFRRMRERRLNERAPRPQGETPNAAHSAWSTALRAALASLAAVVLFVVISEALNYGRTVIEPFSNPGTDGADKKRPGDELANLLVNDLARMRRDIPELTVITNSASGQSGNGTTAGSRNGTTVAIASAMSNPAAAIPGSNEFDLFGLKIPMGSVAALLQDPIRRLFHVEEISGSIYEETYNKTTYWRAVAISNRGHIWRTDPMKVSDSQDAHADNAPITVINGSAPCPAKSFESPIERLAQELAFEIADDAPGVGMTGSRGGLISFDEGISHLNAYDRGQDPGELRAAIACFRAAVTIDHTFANAYYRLAIALDENGEPIRAAEALEAVGNDKPIYVKAMLRRASELLNLDTAYDPGTIMAPPRFVSMPTSKSEPLKLWIQVAQNEPEATFAERRAAYLGICQFLRAEIYNSTSYAAPAAAYLPYFYCKRALAVDTAIPLLDRSDSDDRQVEASILNLLGVLVGTHNQSQGPVRIPYFGSPVFGAFWHRLMISDPNFDPSGRIAYAQSSVSDLFCSLGAIDVNNLEPGQKIAIEGWNSVLAHRAQRYYAASALLSPSDATIKCNYASGALYSEQDRRPMQALLYDAQQRTNIASSMSQAAREFAFEMRHEKHDPSKKRSLQLAEMFYQMAFENYEAARRLDETSLATTNDSAFCLWSWALDAHRKGFHGPDPEDVKGAEWLLRRNLEHFSSEVSTEDYINAATTLAEIHMALGRPEDSAQELTKLASGLTAERGLDELSLPTSLYLDMAQASVCAENVDAAHKDSYQKTAASALNTIAKIEGGVEYRPVTDGQALFRLKALEKDRSLCFDHRPG
jgi:Protein of unknown function (DUF2934)